MYEDRVVLGKNVTFDAGVVFSPRPMMLKIENGQRYRVDVKAGVVVEDDVSIGANSVVNFGVEKDTVIRKGAFLGHFSNIGHDSEIGEHTVLSSFVCVCGHVKIGKWCYIAPQTVIKPKVTIGDYVMIGMGSVVDKDILSGVIAYGSPAKIIRKNEWRPPE